MTIFFVIGNTSIKVARAEGPSFSLATGASQCDIQALLAGASGTAAAASVNPSAEPAVTSACRAAGLSGPVFAGRDFPAGVSMAVDTPGRAGIDRILNVKAAYRRCLRACAVVDLGTAVSISVADGSGRFVGGAIFPGLALSMSALSEHTAFLPHMEPAPAGAALGRDTAEAILSGVVNGARGAIKEILALIKRETCLQPAVFLTGTDSALIAEGCPDDWHVVDGLTLEGLRLAYDESLR